MTSRLQTIGSTLNRVDGRLKVTGGARYSAEYVLPDLKYAVLVTSTIAKGNIRSINTKSAVNSPGVLAVITYVNAIRPPGYTADNEHPTEPATANQPHRPFYNDKIYFNGQPIAVVVADTFERATYAASLVTVQYDTDQHSTDFSQHLQKAVQPQQAQKNPKSPLADYDRGLEDGYKNAPVKLEVEY